MLGKGFTYISHKILQISWGYKYISLIVMMREMYLVAMLSGETLCVSLEENIERYSTGGTALGIVVHPGIFKENRGNKGLEAVIGN